MTSRGGLLAQRSNIGGYSDNNFSLVPEATLRVGFRLSENVAVTAGYTFLYWTDVARAGEQIDTRVNRTQIPPGTLLGPARPVFQGHETDFWAQGVSAGVDIRW